LLVNPVIAALPRQFWDKPLVCVHPAAGNETKQWPEASFAGLIDLLTEERSVHVVLIGGKDETPIADRVLDQVQHKDSVVSLLGALSLQELPLLIRIAALFIGNDSGPKHLAAALGTPTVGIHSGVVDTAEWAPFGRHAVAVRRKTICTPCYVATVSDCHRNLECLRKLRPSDVYAACRDMLAIGLQTLD
jgi:ADP-heptose:LPS heptosyltransferase